ncbi:MAG: tetratricopeptide repeat protein [Fimbriimonas sp.]
MQEPESDEKALKAELARLRVKRSETKDKDIRAALDVRIGQIEAEIRPIEKPPEEEEIEIPTEPPTAQQLAQAEQLVREARVEKIRGNTRGATDLLKKASEVAPGAPAVLEVLGDDLVERKQLDQAKKAYKQAWKLDPKNVGLERKYATVVVQMDAMGSIDDQLRMNLSDSPFSEAEARASSTAAIFLSALLPGLGHVVLGRQVGFLILGAWVLCGIWLTVMRKDLAGLLAFATGGHTSPNLAVLLPVMLMAGIYLGTLASLKSAKKAHKRKPPDRPQPPVDLPFE